MVDAFYFHFNVNLSHFANLREDPDIATSTDFFMLIFASLTDDWSLHVIFEGGTNIQADLLGRTMQMDITVRDANQYRYQSKLV